MSQWIKDLPWYGATALTGALQELHSEYHRHRKSSVAINNVLGGCMRTSRLDIAQREAREQGDDVIALKVRSR